MAAEVKLVTFATARFYRQQEILVKSAWRGGITDCAIWNEQKLAETKFFQDNREIFANSRGAGYWLWKPYLIRSEIESAKAGDFVIYYDVGRPRLPNRLTGPLEPLLRWCIRNNAGMFPGVYIPEHGRNAIWTKRECFIIMNCDEPQYWDHPQIQATFSAWQKNSDSIRILDEWLAWCAIPGVISDEAKFPEILNFPDFVDHRHDQSVLTNIAIRNRLKCYGSPELPIVNSRDMNASKDVTVIVNVIAGRRRAVRWRIAQRFVEKHMRGLLLLLQKLPLIRLPKIAIPSK